MEISSGGVQEVVINLQKCEFMINVNKITDLKDEIENVDEVLALSMEAQNYLSSFNWCNSILDGWLVKEWGYILCVFYFKIRPSPDSGADEFVWIIVGDIPPAYIDIKSAHDEFDALEVYVSLMEEWINNVKKGKSVDNCFPISVSPSKKHAIMLSNRIDIIKNDLIVR